MMVQSKEAMMTGVIESVYGMGHRARIALKGG